MFIIIRYKNNLDACFFNERTQASKFTDFFSSQPISVLSKSVKTTPIPFSM